MLFLFLPRGPAGVRPFWELYSEGCWHHHHLNVPETGDWVLPRSLLLSGRSTEIRSELQPPLGEESESFLVVTLLNERWRCPFCKNLLDCITRDLNWIYWEDTLLECTVRTFSWKGQLICSWEGYIIIIIPFINEMKKDERKTCGRCPIVPLPHCENRIYISIFAPTRRGAALQRNYCGPTYIHIALLLMGMWRYAKTDFC